MCQMGRTARYIPKLGTRNTAPTTANTGVRITTASPRPTASASARKMQGISTRRQARGVCLGSKRGGGPFERWHCAWRDWGMDGLA